jgi:hypothetical protein
LVEGVEGVADPIDHQGAEVVLDNWCKATSLWPVGPKYPSQWVKVAQVVPLTIIFVQAITLIATIGS